MLATTLRVLVVLGLGGEIWREEVMNRDIL